MRNSLFAYRTVLFLVFVIPGQVLAQTPYESSKGGALQASNILNPNVSVIGWFQGEAGHRDVPPGEEVPAAFEFREAEIALQSVVDPYARADFFVAIEPPEGKVDLEEGYLTWFSLPADLSLKAGKAKANFGKFNRVHRPETAFADRPLVHEAYFGEEGLAGVGGALSWHVPNPWLFMNVDAEAYAMPEGDDVPAFETAERRDLLYVGRLNAYHDLTEAANVTLGGSYAHGAAGQAYDAALDSSSTLKSRLYGVDVTFRWKNPRRAIYRSVLWQTELLWNTREMAGVNAVSSAGLFSHLEFQFARRWRIGGRYDWSETPLDTAAHESGGLAYLTFTPSEFSLISVQGKQTKVSGGEKENLGFLKVTFNIGPHGTHPF